MTPAEHDLIAASCARAAELWALGHEQNAERWFGVAHTMAEKAPGEFVDSDHEVDR